MAYHMELARKRLFVATNSAQNVEEKVVINGKMIKEKNWEPTNVAIAKS